MYIKKFAIENYKSYLDRKDVQLVPGFNVIIGQNNAGKSAMLEALSLSFQDRPHRSLETIPVFGGSPPNSSKVHVTFQVPIMEFRELLFNNWKRFFILKGSGEDSSKVADRVIDSFGKPFIHVEGVCKSDSFESLRIVGMDSSVSTNELLGTQFALENLEGLPSVLGNSSITQQHTLAFSLINLLRGRIYSFRAERFHIGQSPIGADATLKSDASNLPQVMHILQTRNPAGFTKLINLMKIVFPDIQQITVPPMEDNVNQAKIFLWDIDPASQREDLALALQESGTGIGQVLSILYVAITSKFPRPILIDEPQSFLHPSAIRKLFDILSSDFSQHQYIVTTHSPIVISTCDPENLILLKKEHKKTQIHFVDKDDTGDLQAVLAEVGARVSDVFGAEKILWVEGSTEENSFPLIVSKILHRPLLGISVLGVLNTGDFEGKLAKDVHRIYQKLSEGGSLLPPAIGFIFDRENRSEQEIEDLLRESKGKIIFLPRRMYENYLINSTAITNLINKLEDFADGEISVEVVSQWIEEHKWSNDYFNDKKILELKDETKWLEKVHGAKFLNSLFKGLSGGKYTYDKVVHGIVLTSWIVDNSPDELEEVKLILEKTLNN